MDISEIFDKQTMDAILADAQSMGISAEEVNKVLGTLTDQNVAPSRSANSSGELMSLLNDDRDAVAGDIADATGVERGKTGTILMLAAPFLLKYLFSSGSSASNANSGMGNMLLSALLGGGMQQQSASPFGGLFGAQPQQQAQPDLLSALLGGGMAQPQQSNSLFGSLLGGGMQQTPAYTNNSTSALLGSLLGGGMTQPQQAYAAPQNNASMGDLMSLFGGAQQPQQPQIQQQQTAQGGGLLNALFNLLGDNG